MYNKLCYFILLITGITLAFGCASRKPVTKKYYVIDLPKNDATLLGDSLNTIDKYCEISNVAVYPAYATRQMVIRSKSHEINYFVHHEWAVRPEEILTKLVEEFLKKHMVFKDASIRFWKEVPEVKVESTVYHFEILEQKGDFMAHLNIEFRLVDSETGNILKKHSANNSKKLEKKDLNLFASKMSEMFHQELKTFAIEIMDEFGTN